MAAFCSWKRWPSRSDPLRYLSTHRITQPSSLVCNDLVVKSLTQSSKHRWTSLEYIWDGVLHQHVCSVRFDQDGLLEDLDMLPSVTATAVLAERGNMGLTVMNSFICFFSIRVCSSRCSAAFRLEDTRDQCQVWNAFWKCKSYPSIVTVQPGS